MPDLVRNHAETVSSLVSCTAFVVALTSATESRLLPPDSGLIVVGGAITDHLAGPPLVRWTRE